MPWFVVRYKTLYLGRPMHSSAIEADKPEGAIARIIAFEPKLEMEMEAFEPVRGPFEKDEAKLTAADENAHPPYKIESVYQTLMDLANKDPHVQFSSKHVEPPALKALMAWGKEPLFNKRIIALLLRDIAAGEPTCHWSHLAAIGRIAKVNVEDKIIPKEHYGRFNDIREDWIKWGKENGY